MPVRFPEAVLSHPALWRGNECVRVASVVPTGFAELDAVLPGGGWPSGALTEIYVERPGIGELQLIMPAIARLSRSERWVTLVSPPHIPYAPALAAQGVRLSQLMLVRTALPDESLWACEQALRSRSCGAVLAWPGRIHEKALRRLQLAAESGGAAALLFRHAQAAPVSPAALRLHVSRYQSLTRIRILKRRGGIVPAPIEFDLHGQIPGWTRTARSSAPERLRLPQAMT